MLFYRDNAPVHSSALAQVKIEWTEVPDRSTSTLFAWFGSLGLFPKLKTFLAGQRFGSNEEAIEAVNDYVDGLEETHLQEWISKLEKRWAKYVEIRGDYVEK